MLTSKDYRRTMLVVIVGAFFTCTVASVANTIKDAPQQERYNKVLTRTHFDNLLPHELIKGLKRFGKITGHTNIDKIMIPSDNDITMETLFPRLRVKRRSSDGDGLLKSKIIKAGEIKSFNIRSNTVLADKILGQSIIADSVHVSKDFRKIKKSGKGKTPKKPKDKTKGSGPKPSKTSDKIKGSGTKPSKTSDKTKGSGTKPRKTSDKTDVDSKKSKHGPSKPKKSSKTTSKKDEKKHPSNNSRPAPIKMDLAQFIHGSPLDSTGFEFIRGNSRKIKNKKYGVGKNRLGIALKSDKRQEYPYDQFVRKRNKKLKALFPDGFPELAESQTGDVKKKKIKKPTSPDDADGLLKAKEIRSNSISAEKTVADSIRADSIKSKMIDAKLINMRKAKKPKLSLFEQSVPTFSVKKKPDFKASWTSFSQPKRTRIITVNVPTHLHKRIPVPNKFGLGELADHDPFAMASIYTKEKKSVNDFMI